MAQKGPHNNPKNKPILLHTCCAPCASGAVERVLQEGWNPTLYYANSNIFPEAEFYKRLNEARRLAKHHNIPLIEEMYNHENWVAMLSTDSTDCTIAELANQPEGGVRCALCFSYNLKLTAYKALELGFTHFTTTLSISPYKNFETLSQEGTTASERITAQTSHLSQAVPIFEAIDFKKQGGYQRSIELSKTMGFYRQSYCGCEFSLRDKEKRRNAVNPSES